MVKSSLSPRDFELLSTYLDHQLSASEQQRLELRLHQEPDLAEALQGLRRTRSMLRSLPRKRAPRNFTLSPAMVGVKPLTSPRPVFGILSALAAVLLIFVLLSDVLLVPGYVGMFPVSLGSPQAQSADQALEMEAAQENQGDVLPFPTDIPLAETDPLEQPAALEQPALEQPALKSIPEDAGGEATQPSEEITLLEQAVPETSTDSAAALDTARTAPEAADEALSSTMEITASVEITAAQIMTSTLEVQVVPTQAVVAVAPEFPIEEQGGLEREGGAETFEQAPAPVGLVQADQSLMWLQLMLWVVELFLAALAVGSAGVAVFMWLKSRP